jgi:serine/threonine protein kinase
VAGTAPLPDCCGSVHGVAEGIKPTALWPIRCARGVLGRRLSAEFLHYVMAYVEGESLRDRLDRERQLRREDALQLTKDVAEGLGYAHSQGCRGVAFRRRG